MAKAGSKPTAAFILTLIGGILVLIGGLFVALISGVSSFVIGMLGAGTAAAALAVYGALGVVFGIVLIVSSVLLYSNKKNRRKTWSVVAIIFSVLSLLTGGGFFVGFVLAIIGGILGLVQKH